MTLWRGNALRLVALFLAVIASGDVTLDAACDPIRFPAAHAAAVVASTDEGADICAGSCVPDCFCCSRSETAGAAVTLPPLAALADARSPEPLSAAAFVPAVPDPPPLALS
jgi:hypothetical protein